MSATILSEIVKHKQEVIDKSKEVYAAYRKNAIKREVTGIFKNQISRPGQLNLIAEIKKASPSKGLIRDDFDLLSIAHIYEDNHAAAISVLTEDKYFLGKPEYIKQVSSHVSIPVLTKDFILTEGQIYEALANGASAVLLIVAILDDAKLKDLIALSDSLGLDSLVEIHNEMEMGRALAAGAAIIGINNRDLATFVVDTDTCLKMAPRIPKDTIIVAESGYRTHEQIKVLSKIGVHAVLIGETFMREKDISKKMKEMMLVDWNISF